MDINDFCHENSIDRYFEFFFEYERFVIFDFLISETKDFDNLNSYLKSMQEFAVLNKSSLFSEWYFSLDSEMRDEILTNVLTVVFNNVQDEIKIIQRIVNAQDNNTAKHKFEDFASEEDKNIFKEAENWDVSDEDLFER